MNDDLQPLRFLAERTEAERDQALTAQLQAEATHRAAVAQHADLIRYRREYEARWQAEFCREGKIELVRCYQGFMERLTQAVEQQARSVDQAAALANKRAATVRDLEMRASGLHKLIQRRLGEGQRVAERAEQSRSDEHAARAAWLRASASSQLAAL